jgi:hypothetical protein
VQFEKDGTAVLELDSGQSVRAADVTRVTINDLTQQGSGTGQSSGTGTAKTDATARLKNDETGGSGGWLAAWLHL